MQWISGFRGLAAGAGCLLLGAFAIPAAGHSTDLTAPNDRSTTKGPAIPEAAGSPTPLSPLASLQPSDTSTGISRELRVHLLPSLSAAPGIYPVQGGVSGHSFALLGVTPFRAKRGATVGSYYLGFWPAELHSVKSEAYENPAGFVEVTAENADLQVSAHFKLGDLVTHDRAPFPKYIVLREALLDKLELVLADLEAHGVSTQHVTILSGFRTPAYNLALGDASGRARESRHQYGDAADIIIDSDHDGRMDDLNGDGRVDAADVRVIESAVDRVEHEYPELAGGLGLYEAIGPSGPFAHVDVRGTRARWGTLGRDPYRVASSFAGRSASSSAGHCYAEGPSAVLCQGFRHSH